MIHFKYISLVRKELHEIDEYKRFHNGKNIWQEISKSKGITEDFLDEFKYKISWGNLDYSGFSEDLILKFKDKVVWMAVFQKAKLSEKFIEEYVEEYSSWRVVSWSQKLSEDFIRKHQDKVHWSDIFTSQALSKEFIEEFEHKSVYSWYAKRRLHTNLPIAVLTLA